MDKKFILRVKFFMSAHSAPFYRQESPDDYAVFRRCVRVPDSAGIFFSVLYVLAHYLINTDGRLFLNGIVTGNDNIGIVVFYTGFDNGEIAFRGR